MTIVNDIPITANGEGEPAIVREPPSNPYDPASLRLTQDFAAEVGVKKLLTTVPVRKPDRASFVRVHPDESYRLQTGVLEVEREVYLVPKALWPELSQELALRTLYTAITRQKVLFLWPVRLPDPNGRQDNWSASANEAAQLATKQWIRISSNLSLGAYETSVAVGNLAEPEWPDLPFGELLRIAFRDRLVDSMSHPVLRQLRGEV